VGKIGADKIHGNVYNAIQAERAAERIDHDERVPAFN
jgi:hypothetical protein